MSIERTVHNHTSTDSLAEGTKQIADAWLLGWSLNVDHDVPGGIKLTPPLPNDMPLTERIAYGNREAHCLRGTTDLATRVLAAMRELLRPGGGNIHDIRRAVGELHKLRPNQNGIGEGRIIFNPGAFDRSRQQSDVATVLEIVAGLPFSGGLQPGSFKPSSPETRIADALAKLIELEAAA